MTKPSFQSPLPFLRVYLLPYALVLILYLLVIGGGSAWLYLTARHAQTELITGHIVDIASPFLNQLNEEHYANKESNLPFLLSKKVNQLYQTLPHLRQVSIRDQQIGYGVRLSSKQQLVDVELEPLPPDSIFFSNFQQLAYQLRNDTQPLFHIYMDLTSAEGNPVQLDIAFDRAGLVGRINGSLQSIIHSIIVFSVLGFLSILLALALAIYTGLSTQKMEARLQKIYQQATMGQLSASLVHDLRNPLASIRANIKNLLITPDETQQVVDEMDHDLLRLERKLTDFLKLTKPRHSGFESIDIEQLVNDLIRECEPLFKEHNIELSVLIETNVPEITVIPEDIRDALYNLLVNAKNHTQKFGHVWIKIQKHQEHLEIIVEDNGSGIDEQLLANIFEPFFTTRDDGHGLGLAIVKRIVKAHQGSIHAENHLPSGARFMMTLPFEHE
jgi:signal transduction histidine kinase